MAKKPSIPKGTRDFSPEEVLKRNYIMNTIRTSFQQYGYQPIETPSFENSDTLMGKYGEEGDRLIFKILNSGDFLSKVEYFYFTNIIKIPKIISEIHEKINLIDLSDYETLNMIESQITDNQEYKLGEFDYDIKYFYDKIVKLIKEEESQSDEYKFLLLSNISNELLGLYLKDFSTKISPKISEKALRYDLTVPFARYVVQHQNEITFPFKRYQMQPVWRADRPQKGRFREFYQCDADVVGSDSLWQEVELVQLYDEVFAKLQLKNCTIKINNRKILSGIAEMIGAQDKLIDFTVALDKLDKIGEEGVKDEMRNKGISEKAISKLQPLFTLTGNANEKLALLENLLATSTVGKKGIEELQFVISKVETLGLKASKLDLDVTLARGLDYYTGAIFEVTAPEGVQMGSIGGGGRYDDLTGIFGLKNVSGVGISFGLDRIYLVLEELQCFPEEVSENSKLLFINFGEKEALYAMQAITKLRENQIAAELYPDAVKTGKQMGYADKRNIAYVVLCGESEIASGSYTLKNMQTGEQKTVSLEDLLRL